MFAHRTAEGTVKGGEFLCMGVRVMSLRYVAIPLHHHWTYARAHSAVVEELHWLTARCICGLITTGQMCIGF